MSDYSFKASSITELKAAFAAANKITTTSSPQTINLNCSGDARAAMEEIFSARTMRKSASTVGAGGAGVGTFAAVSAMTAPFLGPFCVLAGGVAAALAGKGADDISRGVFLSNVIEKYGQQMVSDTTDYSRNGPGAFVRKISGYSGNGPDYSGN